MSSVSAKLDKLILGCDISLVRVHQENDLEHNSYLRKAVISKSMRIY